MRAGEFQTPSEQVKAQQAREERREQLRRQVTPQSAANMAGLAAENPSLSPGALYAAGLAGVKPGTKTSLAMSKADAKVRAERKEFSFGKLLGGVKKKVRKAVSDPLETLYDAAKGTSRAAFTTLQAPGEALQGAFREAASDGIGALDVLNLPAIGARAVQNADQTTLAAVVRQVRRGQPLERATGDGFFTEGTAKKEQAQRAFQQGSIQIEGRGRALTVGRYLAKEIDLEPGGRAFNIVSGLADASIAISTDPSSYVAPVRKLTEARRLFAGDASKTFRKGLDDVTDGVGDPAFAEKLRLEMGAIDGLRATVDSDRVFEFLTRDDRGRTLVDFLAGETDIGKVMRATKSKLDPKLMRDLTERVNTRDEIISMLGPQLGRTAGTGEKFGIDRVSKFEAGLAGNLALGSIAAAKFKSASKNKAISGLFGTVPERVLPKNDLSTAMKNADNFMRNAKLDETERSDILRRMASVESQSEMLEIATDMMAKGTARAVDLGVDEGRARELFKIYQDSHEDRMLYWRGYIAEHGDLKVNRAFGREEDIRRQSDGQVAALPHLASQFLNNNVPLPDPREIKRAISPYAAILNNPAVKVSRQTLEKITDDIFKPAVLLRPAYIVRNQIDEQFRPAGMGLNSMFNHPIQYISWLMHDQDGVGKFLARGGVQTGRGAEDLLGEDFNKLPALKRDLAAAKASGDQAAIDRAEAAYAAGRSGAKAATDSTDEASEYLRSISGGIGNWRNRSPAELKGSRMYQKSDPGYSRVLVENLHLVHTDPLARRVANGGAFRGDGVGERGAEGLKKWWWDGGGQEFRERLAKADRRMDYLNTPEGAAQYVDDTFAFVDNLVGQSDDLRRAAAAGSLYRIPLYRTGKGGMPEVNTVLTEKLNVMKADVNFLGEASIPGKATLTGANVAQDSRAKKVVDRLFYEIADRPTSYLSKSPVFRQQYYRRVENLIGFMDPAAQREAIDAARQAKLKPSTIRRMQKATSQSGKMTLKDADFVAKNDAMEYTRDLFYTLTDRSQFFDATRLLFPFGEAFKDSAVKYAEIVKRNPVVPYRIGQVVQGAEKADPDGDGRGFFYVDEQTGEEMMVIPGMGSVLDTLLPGEATDAVGQFVAPVKNLNILGASVIPGFGPAVQIAASQVLPDTEQFDQISSLINPYGDKTLEGGALEALAVPSWFQKIMTGGVPFLPKTPKQQRAYTNAVNDALAYRASTNEYDVTDPAEQVELVKDAKRDASVIFYVRGLAQAFSPSPPSPEFVAYDKDGVLQTQFRIAQDYRDIAREQAAAGTPEQINRVFLDRYGAEALFAALSNTRPAEGVFPLQSNEKANLFYKRNKDAAERFPKVFGLFAPLEEPGADLDFEAYDRLVRTGQLVVNTPEDQLARANQKVGSMIMQQAKDEAGDDPSPEQKAALRDLKGLLAEKYPGYDKGFKNVLPGTIEDLKRAAKDPKLARTEAGKAMTVWLEAREDAERQFGVGWSSSQKAAPVRAAMRDLGAALIDEYPSFQSMYERVWDREMGDDDVKVGN